jgi:hypothetical protein
MMAPKESVWVYSGGVMNRRQFLKTTGAASAALGSVGLGFFGYEAGRDPEFYTGLKLHEGFRTAF